MDGLFGDGLVGVLCCGGDSLEEDLRWGPRLGALVDLMGFVDGVTSCGVTLFKTVEALSRGAFFFSTSVELKAKGALGGGAGLEIMDSNTSLPWILTPRHFQQFLLSASKDRILPVIAFRLCHYFIWILKQWGIEIFAACL